ncbi:shikimate dehydrogenase [Microbacterium proteolyticum]|uniref:shikimate dehydrogenase family protein n=1 Tax=Microbacterium proteolyticum TaxID=1572644 RepID=UPI0024174BEE|nr:shikimate dehydrogenase [Microbacterium proteolyticum]
MTAIFTFVGVSTQQSAIRRIYPRWMTELGVDARLVGVDLPLDAPREQYRRVVERIADDPDRIGGLVTTHKLNILAASADLFDELDASAALLHEVSCIAKRGGRLVGAALDDRTSMLALDRLRPPTEWRGAQLVLLGAGGASTATTLGLHAAQRAGRGVPSHVHVTARSRDRLDEMAALHETIGFGIPTTFSVTTSVDQAAAVVAGSGERSVVVNATGMGKDRPGSPLPDDVRFPPGSLAWDMNYRGERRFLAQAAAAGAGVVDGWDYFVYSWTKVVSEVHGIGIPPTGPLFDRLSEIAREEQG